MIAPLLKLGGWITDHPKLFCVLVFLAGGLLGILAGRRLCATPSLKAEESKSGAAFGREDLTRKTEEGPSKTTTTERDYAPTELPFGSPEPQSTREASDSTAGPRSSPHGWQPQATQPVRSPILPDHGPLLKEIVTVTERAGTTSETHASSESAQSTTQTLHLEQQGSLAPQWALSVGFENVLHDKALRLSVRRKFLGPIWVEGAFTPATRAVGAGLSIEF